MIPLVDLKRQYQSIKAEIDAAISNVLNTTTFIKGAQLEGFQVDFAAYCESQFAVGASSGTTAIHLALAALGVGPGDEVIVPSHTFIATVEPIIHAGATPVFCDIDPKTYLMDPKVTASLINKRTKAIIPVHLYGQMVPMNDLLDISESAGIHIIEDCAQAHGAKQDGQIAGSLGTVGCFSFFPGKNLGAYGDGGAVTCQDADLAARITKLADHGRETKYTHDIIGYNYRLDSLQAAILRVKLVHMEKWTRLRQSRARIYDEALGGVRGITVPFVAPENSHVYHLYVISHNNRDALRDFLASRGIATGIHYPVPLHLQPPLAHESRSSLGVTEYAASHILSLPLFPELEDEEVEGICRAIQEFCANS
jgi:dTDP-4-amino-4,6-dideoxygalactose transaminase